MENQLDGMTIADLGAALRGIPRNAIMLIDMPDGPKRLRMVRVTRVAERDGQLVQHVGYDRVGIILQTDRY